MFLVTGAAGKTGQAVIAALVQRGKRVTALVRRSQQGAALERLGVSTALVGELTKAADLRRACAGIETIYHICPNMHPQELEIGRSLIAAAANAGVRRVVYHSVLHPQIEAMAHHWLKLRVEELLFESGLAYTILQPAAYMQNILASWQSIVHEGIYRVPYAASTRLGMVDLQDVAAAAARVLVEPQHDGAIYELAGSEMLTQVEVAAILSGELGRPVTTVAIDRAEWAEAARQTGMSVYALDTLLRMFEYYERFGFGGNPFVLTQLLGRRPTTFAEFVRRQLAGAE